MSLKHSLPPLSALLTLEAAARHGSFTRAAEELGVTQTAVSRQILGLEERFGVALFRRHHRTVEPTPHCSALAQSLSRQFHGMAESLRTFADESAKGGLSPLGRRRPLPSFGSCHALWSSALCIRMPGSA